jgi:undecaprenyl-diphosphatase
VDLLTHYLQIILLGIVEGVTEFLPISSTGHLLIAESLGLGHEPDVFNVVIQAGAILAVVFIYWHKIVALLTHLENPAARVYIFKIIAAFLVTSVVSLVIIKHFKLHLPETLTPVAWATLIGGGVIFAIEFLAKNLYSHDDVSWLEALCMGLAQVLAGVFPGTSRSGATIMTGLALGMKRPSATEFSFLLGIPTMFAASALDLWRYRKDLTSGGHQLIVDIVLGFLVSMVVAFFVVKWLLRFVQSHTFNGFAIYRVILGVALLVALATHALPEMGKETGPSDRNTKIYVPAGNPPPPPEQSMPAITNENLIETNAPSSQPIPTLAPAAAPTTNTDSSSSAPAVTNLKTNGVSDPNTFQAEFQTNSAQPTTNAPANVPAP